MEECTFSRIYDVPFLLNMDDMAELDDYEQLLQEIVQVYEDSYSREMLTSSFD